VCDVSDCEFWPDCTSWTWPRLHVLLKKSTILVRAQTSELQSVDSSKTTCKTRTVHIAMDVGDSNVDCNRKRNRQADITSHRPRPFTPNPNTNSLNDKQANCWPLSARDIAGDRSNRWNSCRKVESQVEMCVERARGGCNDDKRSPATNDRPMTSQNWLKPDLWPWPTQPIGLIGFRLADKIVVNPINVKIYPLHVKPLCTINKDDISTKSC